MISHILTSVIFAFGLSLVLLTAHGRTMRARVDDGVYVASSKTSLLDSTSTTNPNDARELMGLINQYPQLYGMQFPLLTDDPCFPPKLIWIKCSNDTIRRVTALYLGGQSLLLSLPDFSGMDALQSIDLRQSSLFGPIPEFLGTFPMLTYLNLANNGFTGPIPDSLLQNKKIKLIITGAINSISGNPGLCSSTNECSPPASTQFPIPPTDPFSGGGVGGGSSFGLPDTRKSKKSKLPVILGFTITPGLLVTIAGGYFAARRHKRNADAAAAALAT